MFFFPVSTNAPVYYWPYATIGLIVLNVLAFVGMESDAIDRGAWLLVHGDGFTPTQWVLSKFAHADLMHLIGNMIFLWVFGLIVEGKLGWWKFLSAFFLVTLLHSVFEQLMMLNTVESGGSQGASSTIYGVLAIATVWAPANEITFFYFFMLYFRIFTGTFEVSVGWVAAFYVGLDFLVVALTGGVMSSSWLHVTGAMVGFPVGIVLLKWGVVDCEGWDIFHVWQGDPGAVKEKEIAQAEAAAAFKESQQLKTASQLDNASRQFRVYLVDGHAEAALKLYEKTKESHGCLSPQLDELKALVSGLHKAGRFAESAPFMVSVIEEEPLTSDPVRIKLAQICVMELDRPGRALELLDDVEIDELPDKHRRLAEKIRQKANQMQDEGVVELDDGGW